MEEPTTTYGQTLLERVSEEIKRSELGSRNDWLLLAPMSKKVYEVYKRDPKNWDIRLASNNDGLLTMVLTAKDQQAHF